MHVLYAKIIAKYNELESFEKIFESDQHQAECLNC